jgi:hypothetical protein
MIKTPSNEIPDVDDGHVDEILKDVKDQYDQDFDR